MMSKDYLGPYYVNFLSITSSFIGHYIFLNNFFCNTFQQLSNYCVYV